MSEGYILEVWKLREDSMRDFEFRGGVLGA